MTTTVLITGANRGLGLEFARQYARDGWRVLAGCRRASEGLQQLASEFRERVEVFRLDVADHGSIEEAGRAFAGEAIDVLLNNAGVLGRVALAAGGIEHQSFRRTDYDDWERIYRVNVFGPMKMAETFVEQVARSDQKKIVTLTSMLGSMGLNDIGGLYGYRGSKAAVNAIMKSMSVDLAKRDILAVAMHPGWVRTDMGGPGADIDVETSVNGVRRVIAALRADQLGVVLAYDGTVLPY